MSNILVRNANAENNFLTLWKSKNEGHYKENIARKKEACWFKQKCQEIEKRGFVVRGQKVFREGQGRDIGDVDLFILDRCNKIALVCQLKWFLIPDRFRHTNVSKLLAGTEQAITAAKWLREDTTRASQFLGIKKKLLEGVEYLPLLISRDWMLNGIGYNDQAPIISEALFDYLLGQPKEQLLQSLWQCIKQKTFLPIENKTFLVKNHTIKLGNVSLEYDRIESIPGGCWSPKQITSHNTI